MVVEERREEKNNIGSRQCEGKSEKAKSDFYMEKAKVKCKKSSFCKGEAE